APLPQRLHIRRRSEGRAASLISLQDHAGHVLRLDAVFAQAALEQVKGGVRRAETVRKRNLHEAGVQVDDPFLQRRDAAGLLRSERTAVERLVIGNNHVLRAAAGLKSVAAAK